MTAPSSTRQNGVPSGFGPRLRALRLAQNRTLDAMEEATGLDKGYMSRVERGQKTPSIAAILRLAAALDISVGELFGERIAEHAVRVVRRKERAATPSGMPGEARVEALSRASAVLEAFVIYPTVEFSAPSEAAEHPGEELLFVLRGTIEMRFSDRGFVLEEGDCAQFPGHLPHRLRRVGTADAAALVAVARLPPAVTS